MATSDNTKLPRWVRTAFWSIVALEWTVVVSGVTVLLWAAVQVALVFSCVPDQTEYAAGYSEDAWSAIGRGDTQERVRALVGTPLERWSHPDDEWWSYSRQRTSTDNYRQRKLRFDHQGRVVEKHETCYID
jgi:outer membrane protein assembly factor BamE (lipoprotein component of BamABCDE complex)